MGGAEDCRQTISAHLKCKLLYLNLCDVPVNIIETVASVMKPPLLPVVYRYL